tara:strand:- start:2014 stop:2430 length:417 start_codon:yes stop_codon:yes gene_type:complete
MKEEKYVRDIHLRDIYSEIESRYDTTPPINAPEPIVDNEWKEEVKKEQSKSWLQMLCLGNRDKHFGWSWYTFYLLPSISLSIDKGEISNLDLEKVQNYIDCEIYFNFLWLTLYVYPIFMWGDKGEIDYSERNYYQEPL